MCILCYNITPYSATRGNPNVSCTRMPTRYAVYYAKSSLRNVFISGPLSHCAIIVAEWKKKKSFPLEFIAIIPLYTIQWELINFYYTRSFVCEQLSTRRFHVSTDLFDGFLNNYNMETEEMLIFNVLENFSRTIYIFIA